MELKSWLKKIITTPAASSEHSDQAPTDRPGRQPRLFISYSRENRRLAQRLQIDLERAGLDAWLDTLHILPCSQDWEEEIIAQIRERTELIHLISPEALCSQPVARETELALEARLNLRRLRLTAIDDVPDDIRKEQVHDWSCRRSSYRDCLRSLLKDFLSDHTLPSDILAALDHNDFQPPFDHVDNLEGPAVSGEDSVRTWLDVTPYTCTWLISPKHWQGPAPDSIAVLLRFSGDIDRHTHQEVLVRRHQSGTTSWLVLVEGHQPNQQRWYHMPHQCPHIWEDSLNACTRLLNAPMIKKRRIDLYLDCPTSLAMAIGQRIDGRRQFTFFQFDRADSSYHPLNFSS